MSALDSQIAGDHYKDMAIQPITFCQKNKLGYAESLAIKYICRHQKKNGKQDIEKAIHCLQLLIELEYSEEEPEAPQSFKEWADKIWEEEQVLLDGRRWRVR
jgi:hypothetical protein